MGCFRCKQQKFYVVFNETFVFKYTLMEKLVVLVLSGKLFFFFEIIEWKIEHLCALNVGKQSKPPLFDFMVAKKCSHLQITEQ